jgi:hypothetical protein
MIVQHHLLCTPRGKEGKAQMKSYIKCHQRWATFLLALFFNLWQLKIIVCVCGKKFNHTQKRDGGRSSIFFSLFLLSSLHDDDKSNVLYGILLLWYKSGNAAMLKIEHCNLRFLQNQEIFSSENLLHVDSTSVLHQLVDNYVEVKVIVGDRMAYMTCRIQQSDSATCILQHVTCTLSKSECSCRLEIQNHVPVKQHEIPLAQVVKIHVSSRRSSIELPRLLKQQLLNKTISDLYPILYRHNGRNEFLRVTIKTCHPAPSSNKLYRVSNFTQFVVDTNSISHISSSSNSIFGPAFEELGEDSISVSMRGHVACMTRLHASLTTKSTPHSSPLTSAKDTLSPVKSILIDAPSGSGIRHIIRRDLLPFKHDFNIDIVDISIDSLMPRQQGMSKQQTLRTILHGALLRRPCVVYIDRIEDIAPNSKYFLNSTDNDSSTGHINQVSI